MPTSNLRDVAGLPTADGRTTRPGVLLRGDAPFPGDAPPGLDWPPRQVVDLRTTVELDHPHPLVDLTTLHHLPLTDALAPDAAARGEAGDLGIEELYVLLTRGAATWLPRLLAIVTDGPWPVLVHCAAGKDRTGVARRRAAASPAGVTRAAVEADFARTNARRGVLWERLVRRGALDPADTAAGVRGIGVDVADLLPALDLLDGDGDGDAAGRPAALAGVDDTAVARWRDVLLTASE